MAFSQITTAEVTKNKPHTDTLGIKFKNNFDAHEDRLNATSGSKNSIPWDALFAPLKLPYEEVTAALTLDATHVVVIGDTAGGAFTITLPSAAANPRVVYCIGEKGASLVTISRSGTDLLVDEAVPAGGTTIVLADGKMIALISDGVSEWRKIWSQAE